MDVKQSVLVVDDDEGICRTLALILGRKGYEAETARTGCQAIEKAKKGLFNATLLDIRLPDMSGLEVFTSLKTMHPDLEVILITGYASVETAVQALNNGASAYITKPLNMDYVLATVQKALEKQRLVREKREAQEALRDRERRFRDIVENATEWIWEVDANGKYTYASPVVEEILGYTPEEVVERHFYDLFHPEDRDELKRMAHERFARKEPFRGFINRNVHKEGKTVWLLTSGVPIVDERGELLGYRGVDTDITERKQAEEAARKTHEELAARVQELAKANEEMQSFMYSISHDLRMPLVAVQGFSSLLEEECGDQLKGEGCKYLSAIADSTGKMSALIDDLLKLSRVGRVDTEPEEVAVQSLVEAITTELKVKTRDRRLNFRIRGPLPEANCNRKRLYQVFSNLLDNAVKFTQDNPQARIEIGVKRAGGNEEFYVRDNGPGIEPQYQKEIFKVFKKFHGAKYEGTGMGLTFAKKIVESWGGSIRLRSQPGEGTTFYFTIPEARKPGRAEHESVPSDSSEVVVR
jgi:PAS domain S-box-containing protein